MNMRTALVLLTLLCAAVWWMATRPLGSAAPSTAGNTVSSTTSRCPMPPRIERGAVPLQTDAPTGMALPMIDATSLQPLAGFSIEARVLGREDYRMGREADISPTDLALGWQRMREDDVLSRLQISQSSRWYSYRWQDQPPLPPQENARSSANMHMIPGNDAVAQALADVRKDERVRIDGWLVEAKAEDGWRWRSSTSRTDTGSGACELVYVCGVTRL